MAQRPPRLTPNLQRPPLAALIAAATLLLIPTPASAYRTGSDLPELSDTARVIWQTRASIELHNDGAPGVSVADTEWDVRDAADAWSAPECSASPVRYGGVTSARAMPGDGRNVVEWVRSSWADLGLAPTAAATTDIQYIRGENGEWQIAEADILVNAQHFVWRPTGNPEDDRRDIVAVLTHEMGHAAGLLHPCEAAGADGAPACSVAHQGRTMHPDYFGVDQATLAQDDIEGICFLYPVDSCTTTSCPAGLVCTPEGCVEPCDDPSCEPPPVTPPPTCEELQSCPGEGQLGDICATDAECRSEVCAAEGYCTRRCGNGVCATSFACDAGVCLAELGTFGGSCTQGEQCISELCVHGHDDGPFCSRECSTSRGCPPTYLCSDVDGTDVCVPQPQGGCAATPTSPATLPLLLAGIWLLTLRRRRTR